MGTPNWRLLAQLDRLQELQAQWLSRQPDLGQLKFSFDEEGQAKPPVPATRPMQLNRLLGEPKSSGGPVSPSRVAI